MPRRFDHGATRSNNTAVINSAIGKWINTTCCACLANSAALKSKGFTITLPLPKICAEVAEATTPHPRPAAPLHIDVAPNPSQYFNLHTGATSLGITDFLIFYSSSAHSEHGDGVLSQ